MRSVSQLLKKGIKLVPKQVPILNMAPMLNIQPLTFKFNYNVCQVKSQSQNLFKSSYEGEGFYVEQMLVGCLAIYSYYVESNGEAFIIDPQNDISKYNQIIKDRKAKLKGVFLTHYHADYVAGHGQLQKAYNCPIYLGPKAREENGVKVLKDGEKIKLGNVELECVHTPGHTEQSSCLLVHNKNGKQDVMFTGDTVFLNEVGRPDLAVKTNLTAKDLAELLYDSIQKVKKFNDDVKIYPGHGSGSACGKSIGSGDFCSLGTQKANNYALKATNKSQFVEQVLKEMPTPPAYFGYNARLNKFDKFDYQEAYQKADTQLSLEEVYKLQQQGLKILDIRSLKDLSNGIIKGALCIDFNGGFATWVGTLIDPKEEIILYGCEETVTQAIKRLLRIGYTNIRGFANFKIEEWKQKGHACYIPQFVNDVFEEGRTILDVRKPAEWKVGIADSNNIILLEMSDLYANVQKLDKSKKYLVHCRSGYRARIAYSFLKGQDFDVKAAIIDSDKISKQRPFDFQQISAKANTKLQPTQVSTLLKSGTKVIDVRSVKELTNGIIHGAICIDLNGGFAPWISALVNPTQNIVIYGTEASVSEAIKKLLMMGYSNIQGSAVFTVDQWKAKGFKAYQPEFSQSVFEEGRAVLDVRKPGQWKNGIADTKDTVLLELGDLFKNVNKLDKSKKYIVHCRSGYRARIAYSFLKGLEYDVKVSLIPSDQIAKLRKP